MYTEKNNEKFRNALKTVNWKEILTETDDANKMYEVFIDKVSRIFRENYPEVKKSRRGTKDKNWITKGIKVSSTKKNKLYKKWIKTRNDADGKI